jgi:prephenate dehydrogenase
MSRWDTVAIVGVGLLGGSLGLALREQGLAHSVIGIGRSPTRLRKARQQGVVTATSTHLARSVADAELVIICTPVETIPGFAVEVARHCPDGALITDVGSTKERIVTRLDRELRKHPRRVRFVGSHPLAGSDKIGFEFARGDLFRGRVVVVTPGRHTDQKDYRRIAGLWKSLGARVVRKTPQKHDSEVATISHLPHLVASALAAGTPSSLLPLVASGWSDTTRVAAGDVELWRQILSDNRDHVLKSLTNFEKVLASFRRALDKDDHDELLRLLEQGKQARDAVGN